MLFSLSKRLRNFLIGENQDFTFYSVRWKNLSLPTVNVVDIYIHIPFCKSMCPYCPYNRIKYDKKKVGPYLNAILKEIEIYKKKLGEVDIGSIYIGGGTPTNLINELAIIIRSIKKNFHVIGNIGIETSVYDINVFNIDKLKKMGVDQISIGVQSFDDKFLQILGRNYNAKDIVPAMNIVKTGGFKSINIDLMFALPGQNMKNVMNDVKEAIKLDPDQITAYPLFTFPYSTVGKYRNIRKLKMPNVFVRRKMYYAIYDFLERKGYDRVSVWGFNKGIAPEYSSVTRERYVGFGAGSATYVENLFYFNTFSVSEYVDTLSEGKLPISIRMKIDQKLSHYYWLYWKLYEGKFSKRDYKFKFKDDKKLRGIIKLMEKLGLIRKKENMFSLTKRGAFWVHLLQNYFMLDYINKVWTVSMSDPWPGEIEI